MLRPHPLLLLALLCQLARDCTAGEPNDLLQRIRSASSHVRLVGGDHADSAGLKLERTWQKDVCVSRLRNEGRIPLRIDRIDLFDLAHGLPAATSLYGEAFQMLAQNGGTLAQPEDWGSYPDRAHYKLEEPDGLRTAHGLLLLRPEGREQVLLGFGSCRRFDGRISFDQHRLLISLDCEGQELAPGQTWELEEFVLCTGKERESLLSHLANRIEINHPRRKGFKQPPLGWCSWYCFGPNVTVADIRRNLDWIATNAPQLRYIQIDDGYQPWMGDWLETGKSFGGDIKSLLHEIKGRGFQPAIWVAPFVASPQSKLFHDHPDWFVKGADGTPLRSDSVGFGGWRLGPWYALDGTHPAAQEFLEQVFRTMRREWGCTYFKLDANYWGALHHGHFYDPRATRIQAYRRGMEAILRGAGDAFVLGCNHPLWPSLGLVDGARSSMDISRDWPTIRDIGRQNLLRAWQNGRFWWNDPDCLVLSPSRPNTPTDPEVQFHATVIHASGGMLLSGDDLPALKAGRVAMLKQLIPPTSRASRFDDESLTVGRGIVGGREYIYLFNWRDEPADRIVDLPGCRTLKDYWTGKTLSVKNGSLCVRALPPHSARLLVWQSETSKLLSPKSQTQPVQ